MSAQQTIDEILKKGPGLAAKPADEGQADKFYSILLGEGLHESFLELQFRDGSSTCFPYKDLSWFNHNPESGIDLDFSGFQVIIRGRGLAPKLWNGIKQMRVAWVKEADDEMQDHKGNDCFIEEISIRPPDGFTAEEEPGEQ